MTPAPAHAAYAREVFAAALAAADPAAFTRDALERAFANHHTSRPRTHRIFALGKAAPAMAQAALAFCATDRRHVASGIVVGAGPISIAPAPLETITGDHPIPRDRSALAAERLEEHCERVGSDDVPPEMSMITTSSFPTRSHCSSRRSAASADRSRGIG